MVEYRIFDGKRFKKGSCHSYKADANEAAEKLRSKGWLIRIDTEAFHDTVLRGRPGKEDVVVSITTMKYRLWQRRK